ncbi:hypothetical protein Q5752_002003 [Cryptotrichosporon argae]
MAGYVKVSMTSALQCNTSLVEWSGDDGPYHLLFTPTTFAAHSYNIWVQSIPNGTTAYNLTIDQAEGTQYMVTVWGASGISMAGTTDVLTIGAPYSPSTPSCFLTDAEILSLYTFSFNITNTNDDFPPQCSNLSMTWPSSLESNVTGTTTRRALAVGLDGGRGPRGIRASRRALDANLSPLNMRTLRKRYGEPGGTWSTGGAWSTGAGSAPAPRFLPRAAEIDNDDTSSSNKTSGNTTAPPTMFGIIPLGNSFSIPITYSTHSKFASSLPASSLSDTPTTWTSQGVTHLNWTIDLAKGTRFILVAGIGSEEEWASGGSSEMLTVGQGSTGCVGSEQSGSGAPSVTATGTSSSDATSTATPISGSQPRQTSWRGVIVACVFSVVGTLAIVGALWFCCRVRRRRRLAAAAGGSAGIRLGRAKAEPHAIETDTELDLVGVPDAAPTWHTPAAAGRPVLAPLADTQPAFTASPSPTSPGSARPHFTHEPSIDSYASPISPVHPGLSGALDRHESMDALLPHTGTGTGSGSPVGSGSTAMSRVGSALGGTYDHASPLARRPRGPLVLHTARDGDGDGDDDDVDADGEQDIAELKRDTLAYLGASTGPSGAAGAERERRRRRQEQEEMSYVVHRDAGRVRPSVPQQRVMELPPRYEELDWDAEREREREGGRDDEGEDSPGAHGVTRGGPDAPETQEAPP